jgi:hypothetical protein
MLASLSVGHQRGCGRSGGAVSVRAAAPLLFAAGLPWYCSLGNLEGRLACLSLGWGSSRLSVLLCAVGSAVGPQQRAHDGSG